MENKHCSVKLRRIERKDANILMELNNNDVIAKSVVGNPRKVNIEEQLLWMDSLAKERNTVRMMIEYGSNPVGTIIISSIDLDNETGNMNIKILPEFHGKGIGTKALALACQYAFVEMKLSCLTAHILSDNLASVMLFKKIGFIEEGVLRSRVVKEGRRRDLLSLSCLKSDSKWRKYNV